MGGVLREEEKQVSHLPPHRYVQLILPGKTRPHTAVVLAVCARRKLFPRMLLGSPCAWHGPRKKKFRLCGIKGRPGPAKELLYTPTSPVELELPARGTHSKYKGRTQSAPYSPYHSPPLFSLHPSPLPH
ncbi:hypothetical protein KOW79_006184 [Hemibagrus wyckioides]|uniref:Uncharacterized protein n=1 Tax=Hemibagrus wyckioides TaxID=337641 RepID=A0A9D3SMV0_9TELE|nr:hypothetical protein KOW79_006184 [Hemibagrus wyckioides]